MTVIPSETWVDKIILEPSGCWSHENKLQSNGYLKCSFQGRLLWAHRVAYEWLVGPIPLGLTIDHLCRHPWCINPVHMEPVTISENLRRGNGPAAVNARKTHCLKGHALEGENVSINRWGRRVCNTCAADRATRDNSRKTHCIHGHEFTPENTRVSKHGRRCRMCHRERQAFYNARTP